MPSSGSRITYKILNSLIAPRDSPYLQARLIKVLLQLTRNIHDRHIPMSLAKRYKIYMFPVKAWIGIEVERLIRDTELKKIHKFINKT